MAKRRAPCAGSVAALIAGVHRTRRSRTGARFAAASPRATPGGGLGTEISGLRSPHADSRCEDLLRRAGAGRRRPRCDPAPVAGTRIAYREGKQHLAAAGARRTAPQKSKTEITANVT